MSQEKVYLIKKNEGSVETPWLCYSARFQKLVYMSFKQLEIEIENSKSSYAVNYPDEASALAFIKDNQGDTCHSVTITQQMTIDSRLIDNQKDAPS